MKVCTDACLFGAYVADQVKTKSSSDILDIGTGTGLLSLMLAQRVPAIIEAVEIDAAACEQANNNFGQSPWKERLTVFNSDVLQFEPDKKYDCIISNPPFFEKDLKSIDSNKNNAKHDTSLTLEQLLAVAKKLLTDDGTFAVLLPYHRVEAFIVMASNNSFHLIKKAIVKQTENHDPFRGILIFGKQPANPMEETIVIKNTDEKYSLRFAELLKDYYLYL